MPIYNDNKTKKILSVNCFDSSFVKGKIGGEAIKASYCIAKSHISLRGSSHSGGSWQMKKCDSFLLCKNNQKLSLGKTNMYLFRLFTSANMSGFSASSVAFNVQKNFANKFFSNKSIVKGLIDETSAKLLDDLYNLIFAFVSDFLREAIHSGRCFSFL